MHIPDAYLSPVTQLATAALMLPVWAIALRKTRSELSTRQTSLLSIGAAFCFAIQMFNIPSVGGTTAHALGAVLLAILVGPWGATIGMTLTVAIQALLFGDGGVLSIGANSFNMAAVAVWAGFGMYRLAAGGQGLSSSRGLVAAGIGAYFGSVIASLSAGLILGLQPMIAHDSTGHALYCPFGWGVTIPAMVMSHLLVAGPAEAIITVAALSYLRQSFPDLLCSIRSQPPRIPAMKLVRNFAFLLALTPLGLLASGEAWGEWSPETLQRMVGYTPRGMESSRTILQPVLPDYSFGGLSGWQWNLIGYLVSAGVGSLILFLFVRTLLRKTDATQTPVKQEPQMVLGQGLPEWMMKGNPQRDIASISSATWLERTLLSARTLIYETVAQEKVAHSPGFLQSLHPTAKVVGFGSAMVACSLTSSPLIPSIVLATSFLLAQRSGVPMKSFIQRIFGTTVFFGGFVAIGYFTALSPFPAIGATAFMLLRLATSIALALLWNLTTPWSHILHSLSALKVPQQIRVALTLTYRYLFVVTEALQEMVEARTSRQVGALAKLDAQTYAGTGAAVLFSKSMALTEEVHHAMVSRGIALPKPSSCPTRWSIKDAVLTASGAALLMILLLQGVFHAF